jgi:hypothetical protein
MPVLPRVGIQWEKFQQNSVGEITTKFSGRNSPENENGDSNSTIKAERREEKRIDYRRRTGPKLG